MSLRDEGAREPIGTGKKGSPESVDLDVVFEILSDERRRTILEYFNGEPPKAVDFECLCQFVVEREHESDEAVTKQQIRNSLHHIHLPKLADSRVLDWDSEAKTIRYFGSDRIESVLSIAESH